jgi:natural product biosynthesis luciferase-like monooxygenase protein
MNEPTIQAQFAARCAASPAATAVSAAVGSASYAEVARRARAVAGGLRRGGVAPGATVAVLVERSRELPAALLGILDAGAAFLPLDPTLPPGRLAQLLAAARPAAVLASRSLARRLPPQRAPLLRLEDLLESGSGGGDESGNGRGGGSSGGGAHQLGDGAPVCAFFAAGAAAAPALVRLDQAAVRELFAGLDRGDPRSGAAGAGGGGPSAGGSSGDAAASAGFDRGPIELLWALCRGRAVELDGRRRAPDFSLFYFGNYAAGRAADHYRLVLEGARFADRHGFRAIWTPERHFHEFGGLFPNPAVLGAAVAASTERLAIRAGSVVLPLHDPLRVAEEWALVDNLSGGRVGVSFASGWHANDFVLKPGAYQDRQEIMRRGIDTVRRLWRGEALHLPGGAGNELEVRTFPRPVQRELPVWVTAAGSPETFRLAGELGAGLLTHLLGQGGEEFAGKIRLYREAWRAAGHGPGEGHVTVMLHTFVGERLEAVHAAVREPLGAYLKTSFGLLRSLAQAIGVERDPRQLSGAELDLLVARAYDRYVGGSGGGGADGAGGEAAGLIGTPATCAPTVERLARMGVDEVACLIDFGVPTDQVLASLPHLDELRSIMLGECRPPSTS